MPHSLPVTNWGERLALVAVGVAVFAVLLWLMQRGWRKRAELQSDIALPLPIPANFTTDLEVHGRYLASTAAGAWLTRIVAHGLGLPARAEMHIGRNGIAVYRDGAAPFYIPKGDVVDVRSDRAIAGKAFEKDGIVVVTWRLGDVFVDTGFRADNTDGHVAILKMMVRQESGA